MYPKKLFVKKILSILLSGILIILTSNTANAQGRVAIKGTAGICSRPSDAKGWEIILQTAILDPTSILLAL